MTHYLIASVIFFVVALLFMAGELLVPTHGILAAFCVVFFIAGAAMAFLANPALGVLASLLILVAAPIAFYWAVRIYPHTPVGRRVMLQKPEPAAVQAFSDRANVLQSLQGKQGTAVTLLRPAGVCEFEGRRVDSVAESTIIEAGAPVEVVRVVGLKVIVRAL